MKLKPESARDDARKFESVRGPALVVASNLLDARIVPLFMDFLPGGATNKKAVSLGGRRKETKSREALLQEAKIKREQRNAAAAPAKASTIIQRHVRGLFTRRRLSAQFSTAAEGALSAAAANTSPTTLLAAARKLGLLWATGPVGWAYC